MRAFARAAVWSLLMVWHIAGIAATRCEDAAGKVTYVEGACPAGTKSVREVGKPAAPAVTDQTTAVNRASQEYKDAERLRIAREKQENKQASANAAATKRANAQAKKCERLAVRVKRAKEDEKSVTPKDAEKKKLKRTRLEEDYAMQCKR
ncbi:MAG: hypothetical protein RL341_2194 [Pseudomonadota bacterium]|jgi:hypothetical protein